MWPYCTFKFNSLFKSLDKCIYSVVLIFYVGNAIHKIFNEIRFQGRQNIATSV